MISLLGTCLKKLILMQNRLIGVCFEKIFVKYWYWP